jgi:2,3-bisphosphoglycerate-independent phosphoglycerate mutase
MFYRQPVSGKLPSGANEALLMRWMKAAYELLKDHPINLARVAAGKNRQTQSGSGARAADPR